MKRSKEVDFMGAFSKDVMDTVHKDKALIKSIRNRIHKMMRKHGICQGIKEGNGVRTCNPEWVLATDFYLSALAQAVNFTDLLSQPPKDIYHYDEEKEEKQLWWPI